MFTLQGDQRVMQKMLSSRVTLLLPGVSIAEVPAGAHHDLQTGSVWVVVEGKLQFSHHTDALEDATFCAVAALRGQTQREKPGDAWERARMIIGELQQELIINNMFLMVLSTYPLPRWILRTKGSLFFCPSGWSLLVAVFGFFKQVWQTGTMVELDEQ